MPRATPVAIAFQHLGHPPQHKAGPFRVLVVVWGTFPAPGHPYRGSSRPCKLSVQEETCWPPARQLQNSWAGLVP